VFGLFLAGYTGVLLSVSNQPIWSDTWALGGLFLASGLSVAAAAVGLLARLRSDGGDAAEAKLSRVGGWFIVLELALLAVFFLTLGGAGAPLMAPRFLVLWALVAVGTLLPLAIHLRSGGRGTWPALASVLVLVGGFALRMAVVFAAQA